MNINNKNTIIETGDCLKNGVYKFHSGFTKVINYINGNNDFCFITNDCSNSAPNSITKEIENVKETKSIFISDNYITIGTQKIIRKNIPFYNSHIETALFNPLNLLQNLDSVLKYHKADFHEKSLAFLLFPENIKYFDKAFDKAFAENAIASFNYIISGNILQGVHKIKGTGYGLTPSGDDFIAGFLFGIHLNEIIFKKNSISLRNEIYDAALGKNPFTNSFLLYAKNAKYFYRLKNFVTLLSEKKIGDLDFAIKQLLSHGATSGADLLTGLIISIKNSVGL